MVFRFCTGGSCTLCIQNNNGSTNKTNNCPNNIIKISP